MRWVRAIVCALAVALAATAMPARAETVVRWATPEPLLTWDPHGANLFYSIAGHWQVYEALTTLDPDLRLVPALATSWELVDPRTWRFERRQGVRFHDGSPLTAADVAFSLLRAVSGGSQAREVAPLYRPTLVWAMCDWLDVPINAINTPWFWQAPVTGPSAR